MNFMNRDFFFPIEIFVVCPETHVFDHFLHYDASESVTVSVLRSGSGGDVLAVGLRDRYVIRLRRSYL